MLRVRIVLKGGAGSGNFDHAGRPGKVGGSFTYRSRVYHGSPNQSLSKVVANPESRQYDNATSVFGAFFTPNQADAQHYAGDAGRVYETDLELRNPANMTWGQFQYFQDVTRDVDRQSLPPNKWEQRMRELTQEALDLKNEYIQQGHDGVVVTSQRGDVKEIAVFDDVVLKGGVGSGNFDHAGRPGKVGGSASTSIIPITGQADATTMADVQYVLDNLPHNHLTGANIQFNDKLAHEQEFDGAYDFKWGNIYLRPVNTKGDVVRTLLHEIGHHVTNHKVGVGPGIFPHPKDLAADGRLSQVLVEQGKLIARGYMYGLTDYEFSERRIGEMHAGLYRVFASEYLGDTQESMGLIARDLPMYHDIYSNMFTNVVEKGGAGSGNFNHAGRPGKVGGSAQSQQYLPAEQRVWQGRQVEGAVAFNQNETGRRGEQLAAKALSERFGVPFSTMNVGMNNAPIDVAGDHHAIEVKTGPATNGRSAQQWRITTSYTSGPAEKALIAKMTPAERTDYNTYKQEQSMARKLDMMREMSEIAGQPVEAATVGVILSPDGKQGDVFLIPGFHLRLGWNKYATEDYYIGTWEVDE